MITGSQLRLCGTTLSASRSALIADLLNQVCPTFNVTGATFKMFVAQVLHESSEFVNKAENMTYTTPARIISVWPSRFNALGDKGKLKASDYANNPAKLGNTVYANRMGNGDFASGDGYNFRGRGWLQLTGRESYQKCGTGISVDLIGHPELLLTDDVALKSACWEYAVDKKMVGNLDISKVTRAINGGLIGLDSRKAYYAKVLKFCP